MAKKVNNQKTDDKAITAKVNPQGIKAFLKEDMERSKVEYTEEKANKVLSAYGHNYDNIINDAGKRGKVKDVNAFRAKIYSHYGFKPDEERMAEIDFLKKPSSTDTDKGYERYQELQDDRTLTQSMIDKFNPSQEFAAQVGADVRTPQTPEQLTAQAEQAVEQFSFDPAMQEKNASDLARREVLEAKLGEFDKSVAEQASLNIKKFGFASQEHEDVGKKYEQYSSTLDNAISDIEGGDDRTAHGFGFGFGSGTAAYSPEGSNKVRKVRNLRNVKELYGQMGKILGSPQGDNFTSEMNGLLHGFSDNFFTKDFATLGLSEMDRLLNVKDAFDAQSKYKNEGKSEEEISELMPKEQIALLDTYKTLLEIQAGNKGNFGSTIGEGLKEMIPFIAQFAATSGVGAGAKKLVKEFVEAKTKSALAGRIAGVIAKPLVQAAAMVPAELQNYAQRVAPTMDQDGNLIEGQEPINAALKAYVTTVAEVAGEDLGELTNKFANIAARKNFARLISTDANKSQKFLAKVSLALTRETNLPGIQGLPFEVAGEEATGIMQAAIDQDGNFFTAEAQKQVFALSLLASGGFAAYSIPARLKVKSQFNSSVELLNDIPNADFANAVNDLGQNFAEPEEAFQALDDISSEFDITKEDYLKARNFIGNSIRYNQMNTVRSIQVEQRIAQSVGSDGNVTLTEINGQLYSVRNPQDLGPGNQSKVIYVKAQDGTTVSPIISSKITQWETKSQEDIISEYTTGEDAQDDAQVQEEQVQEEAIQRGLIEGVTVVTPKGKRKLLAVNPDGTATVENDKGEPEIASTAEIEAYKTQEQKDIEKEEAKTQENEDMLLMEGIEEGSTVESDELLTDESDIRIVDFSNGQSKIIKPDGESIYNTPEERDAAISELVSGEIDAKEGIDDLAPDEAFGLMYKENPEIAEEIFTEEINDVRAQAKEARSKVKETKSRKEKQNLLLKAKELETEADRLDLILQNPTSLDEEVQEDIYEEEAAAPIEEDIVDDAPLSIEDVSEQLNQDYQAEKDQAPFNQLTPWQQDLVGMKVGRDQLSRAVGESIIAESKDIKRSWIVSPKKETRSNKIDNIAQELSATHSVDVTPQDIFDFILDNPTNSVRKTTNRMGEIAAEYKELTGRAIKNHQPTTPEATTEDVEGFGQVEEVADIPFRADEGEAKDAINIFPLAQEDLKNRTNILKALNELQEKFGIPINVVNWEEVPQEVLDSSSRLSNVPKGFYYQGEAYIVSNPTDETGVREIARVSDAKKTYLHEVILHKGLDVVFAAGDVTLLGKTYGSKDELLNDVFDRMDEQSISNRAAIYYPGVPLDQLTEVHKRELAEEVLATMNETESPRLQVLMDKLHKFIKRLLGFSSKQFSKTDLRNLLYEHRNLVVGQKQNANISAESIDGDIRFRTEEQSGIIQDAKTYDSVHDFIKAYDNTDFRGAHTAPMPSYIDLPIQERLDKGDNINLIEVSQGHHNQPLDYFDPTTGPKSYGYDNKEGAESLVAVSKILRNIEKQVADKNKVSRIPKIKAYRSIPNNIESDKLSDGEWITFSKTYAKIHGESRFGKGEYKTIIESVPADAVWWDGNDINEWGYVADISNKPLTNEDLIKIWKVANPGKSTVKEVIKADPLLKSKEADLRQKLSDKRDELDAVKVEKRKEGVGLLQIRRVPEVAALTAERDLIQEDLKSVISQIKEQESVKFRVEAERENVEINPSEAQKESGNYKMGHIKLDGFDISIENPRGSIRSGRNQEGEPWSNIMPADYGYFKGTIGNDKDHIDVFMGENLESNNIYVVDQVDPNTGKFDEHKIMMGYNSLSEAKTAYNEAYDEGWEGLGNISRTTNQGLKDWFKGDTKKPFTPIDTDVKFRATSTNPDVQKMLNRLAAIESLGKSAARIKELEKVGQVDVGSSYRSIKNQIEVYKKAAKEGKSNPKKLMESVQTAIVDYAKLMLPLSDIGSSQIGSILTLVRDSKTPKALIKSFERIDELTKNALDKIDRKKHVSKVNRLLKWMTGLKKSGNRTVGKFNYTETKAFQNLKDIDKKTIGLVKMTNSHKASVADKDGAVAELDKMWNELDTKEDKNDLDNAIMKLIELRRLGSKASPKLAQIVSEELEAIYKRAKESKTEADMAEGLSRKQDKDFIKSFLTDRSSLKKLPWYKSAMTKINSGVEDISGNWETLMTMIGGTKLRDEMSFLIDESNVAVGKQKTNDAILDAAKSIYDVQSKTGTLNKIHELSKTEFELRQPNVKGKVIDVDGMELSKLHLMDIYNALKNPDVQHDYYMSYGNVSLKEDGSRDVKAQKENGQETIDALINNMSEKDKAFADAMQVELDKYYIPLNENHIKLYNRDLPRVENYWPSTAEREQDIDIMEQAFVDSRHPSSTKERSAHRTPLPQDAFNKFTKHVDEAEWYINMALPVLKANKLFKDIEISKLIKDARGNKFYTNISEGLQNVTLSPPGSMQQTSALNGLLNPVLNNWVAAKIGGTPSVPLKQLLSSINYAENMPMEKWAVGLVKGLASPKDTWRTMMEIPYLKARLGDGYSEAVQRALNGDDNIHRSKLSNYHTAFKNLSTIGTRFGDITAIIFGGKPYLDYLISEGMKKEGAIESEVQKEAVNKFLQDTLRSQQAPFSSSLSKLQNSKNIFLRAAFTFSNTPSQYMRKLFESSQNLRIQKEQLNKGNITQDEYNKARKQTIKAHTIYGLINTVSFTMTGALVNAMMKGAGIDDDIWEDMLVQLAATYVGGLPIIKDILDTATRQTLGVNVYEDSNPYVEALSGLIEEGIKLSKGESNDKAKSLDKIGQSVADMIAVPYGNIKKNIKAIPPFREETFKATRIKEVRYKLTDLKKDDDVRISDSAKAIAKSYAKAKAVAKKFLKDKKYLASDRVLDLIDKSKIHLWKSEYSASDMNMELKQFNKMLEKIK